MNSILSTIISNISIPDVSKDSSLQFFVERIPSFENHFFGRTSAGYLCLLLFAKAASHRSPIRMTSIDVTFAMPCSINFKDEVKHSKTLTAITCTTLDKVTNDYFMQISQMILGVLEKNPSFPHVVDTVNRFVDIFQKLSIPARKSVTGLFGELYIIHVAESPANVLSAWRIENEDRFDFSIDNIRIEVKVSTSRDRAHFFSREQCFPPENTLGLLFSLFLDSAGGGLSLEELVKKIELQIGNDPKLNLKLHEGIVDCLGSNYLTAASARFDENVAKSSLQIYDLCSIPAVRNGVPDEVSRIKFYSDISRTPTVSVSTIVQKYNSVKCLLPKWIR